MSQTFRDLVDAFRTRGRRYNRPRTMAEVADLCNISRVHLHNLLAGRKGTTDWTIARIARALKVSENAVRAAINATHREAQQ